MESLIDSNVVKQKNQNLVDFFNRFKRREEDKKPIPEVIKTPTPQVTPIPKIRRAA